MGLDPEPEWHFYFLVVMKGAFIHSFIHCDARDAAILLVSLGSPVREMWVNPGQWTRGGEAQTRIHPYSGTFVSVFIS